MRGDSDGSGEYYSAPSLSSSPSSQRAEEDQLSLAPTEISRQISPIVDTTATRILNRIVALMQRNQQIETECAAVLSDIVEKVEKSAEFGGVPVVIDRNQPAYHPSQPSIRDIVRGYSRPLRRTAPEFTPAPKLNPKAAEFCPIKT